MSEKTNSNNKHFGKQRTLQTNIAVNDSYDTGLCYTHTA